MRTGRLVNSLWKIVDRECERIFIGHLYKPASDFI
jgi:hypothetical protein